MCDSFEHFSLVTCDLIHPVFPQLRSFGDCMFICEFLFEYIYIYTTEMYNIYVYVYVYVYVFELQ